MVCAPTDRKMAAPLIPPLRVSRRLYFPAGRRSPLTFKQPLTCEKLQQISFYCEAKGGINEGTVQCTPSTTPSTTVNATASTTAEAGHNFDGIRRSGSKKDADEEAGG